MTTTTTTTPTIDHLQALADAYETALRRHLRDIHVLPVQGVGGGITSWQVRPDPAVDQTFQELLAALRQGPDTEAVEQFAATATTWLAQLHRELENPGTDAPGRRIDCAYALDNIHRLLGPLYGAASTYADHDQITTAQRLVNQLRGRQANALAAVEAAVSEGDLDALPGLRRTAELDVPGDLAEAEADYWELIARRDETRAVPGRELAARGDAELKAADQRIDDLLAAVEQARLDREEVARRATSLNNAAEPATTAAAQARHRADQARDRLQADHEMRVRHLAGLL